MLKMAVYLVLSAVGVRGKSHSALAFGMAGLTVLLLVDRVYLMLGLTTAPDML